MDLIVVSCSVISYFVFCCVSLVCAGSSFLDLEFWVSICGSCCSILFVLNLVSIGWISSVGSYCLILLCLDIVFVNGFIVLDLEFCIYIFGLSDCIFVFIFCLLCNRCLGILSFGCRSVDLVC